MSASLTHVLISLSSYLHRDDARHPADLRLPRLAAEMPEEEKAQSRRAMISTSLLLH